MIRSEVEDVLLGIEMVGTRFAEWDFAFTVDELTPTNEAAKAAVTGDGTPLLLRCSFERPDADTGDMDTGKGRGWFIEADATEDSVVKTAWLAMKQIVDHELMEAFTYNSVRVFDPHKSIEDLTHGSRAIGGYVLKVPAPEKDEATDMFAGGSAEGLALTLGLDKAGS